MTIPQDLTVNAVKLGGVYTSPFEHFVPEADCHPHCKGNEGDNFSFQESYPVALDPNTARVACRPKGQDNPCAFAVFHVEFDNISKTATVYVKSRSSAMYIRVQGDIL